jgi:hypothetical protein
MTETDSAAMPEPDQAEPRAMQSRPSSPWNAERDTRLRELNAQGLSAGRIANELGTTRNAVIGRSQRIGLAKTGRALSKRRLQRAAPKAKAPAIVHRPGKGFARTGEGRALVKTKNPFFGFGQPGNRRAPHKVAVPGISDIPVEPETRFAVSIWDAGAKHCRWPLNDSSPVSEFRYCGAAVLRGCTWCAFHAARGFTPVRGR